jgi:hypothetical protein
MTIVADAEPNGDWADDRFVGDTLAKHGISVQRIPDYARLFPAVRRVMDSTDTIIRSTRGTLRQGRCVC